jgi:hypothetical protein
MATRGRPLGPRNTRFAAIPRAFNGCIYAAQFSNGIVKVGYSRNPRTRMSTLSNQARRIFASELVAWHIGPDMPSLRARYAEMELIRRMTEIAPPLDGRIEYFERVDYECACELVNAVASEA